MPLAVPALTCKERNERYRYLPPAIGKAGNTFKTVFPLLCDTVEVAAGKTTEVEAGTMLAFARPQSGNAIRVAGTLRLKGTKDTWVFLSGSLDSTRNKLEPGKATWSGLIVEPGGKLVMEYAGVWGAPTPITAFSQTVMIKNSFFTGASGIVQPDGEIYELDPTFAAVNDIDFSRFVQGEVEAKPVETARKSPKPDGLSADEKEKLLARPAPQPFWTAGKVWGLTLLTVAAGGAGAWYYLSRTEAPPAPLKQTPIFEALPPDFPAPVQPSAN